jgi:hypothetical protein
MRLTVPPVRPDSPSADVGRRPGHAHFWKRAMSRRQVLQVGLGVTGALVTSGIWSPVLAKRASSAPKPIPGVVFPGAPFHIRLPGHGNEPSAITDFNGFSGLAELTGAGDAWEPGAVDSHRLTFDVDLRFMTGTYIGQDASVQTGTFAFT